MSPLLSVIEHKSQKDTCVIYRHLREAHDLLARASTKKTALLVDTSHTLRFVPHFTQGGDSVHLLEPLNIFRNPILLLLQSRFTQFIYEIGN